MRSPARILIADDNADNLEILRARLGTKNYEVISATDGEEALALARSQKPDLILLDVMMPKIDGVDVCRRIKADPELPFTPIIMVTAKSSTQDVVAALDAGADEYLTKPVDHGALVARVNSMLRIKALNDTVRKQSVELAEWNATLEKRISEQLGQLECLSRLKRFFSPQLAEAILAGGAADPLATHRREIAVVFLDLRGFTAFSEAADPEDVMGVLREYHAELGKIILAHEGTLERFTGDGMMIFFNDPVVVADPATRAVRMAMSMIKRVDELSSHWHKSGFDLALGIGIAQGYATIGAIGFEGRIDYGAVGNVINLAARICDEAKAGEILTNGKTLGHIEDLVQSDAVGELKLRGLAKPVSIYRIVGLKT